LLHFKISQLKKVGQKPEISIPLPTTKQPFKKSIFIPALFNKFFTTKSHHLNIIRFTNYEETKNYVL